MAKLPSVSLTSWTLFIAISWKPPEESSPVITEIPQKTGHFSTSVEEFLERVRGIEPL
jgi:hypothetical protein